MPQKRKMRCLSIRLSREQIASRWALFFFCASALVFLFIQTSFAQTPTASPLVPAQPPAARSAADPPANNGGDSNRSRANQDEYNFGSNSLGKAGEKVVEAIPGCGNDASRCQGVARSLDRLETVSNISDYVSYGAIAGTIGPMMIYDSNQQKDMEQAAKIQQISGYANIAAGATDVAIGLKVRTDEASTMESVRQSQNRLCGFTDPAGSSGSGSARRSSGQAVPRNAQALDAGQGDAWRAAEQSGMSWDNWRDTCGRYQGERQKMRDAVKEIKDASNTHFLVGGLKAAGGVAALYLAQQSEKTAKSLASLKAAEQANQAVVAQQQALLSPQALTPPSVGYVPSDTTTAASTTADTSGTTPRSISYSGASAAPTPDSLNGLRRNQADSSSGGRGGAGAMASAAAGGRSGGSGASEETPAGDGVPAVPSETTTEWAGGGNGSLNRGGGMELGGGDGGFASLLGQMTQGMGGGSTDGGPAADNSIRMPASADDGSRAAQGQAQDQNSQNSSLFDRVRDAIGRQVQSGNIVSSTAPNVNKL